MLVREVQRADLKGIASLDAKAQPSPWSIERFSSELDLEQSHLTLAELNGMMGGYLCVWEFAGEIEIQNIVTAPEFRRQGVAQALLDELLDYAQKRDVSRMLLEVRSNNAPAIGLYRLNGFTECGIRRGYYTNGEDALLMEKILTEH